MKIWTTEDGRQFHVERMDVNHIWNCMRMLRRQIDNKVGLEHTCSWEGACADCDNNVSVQTRRQEGIRMFEIELRRRGLSIEIDHAALDRDNELWKAVCLKGQP